MRGHPAVLTIAGETRTVAQWARLAGVNYNTLHQRLQKGIRAHEAVFGGRYSTHRLDCGETAPAKRKRGRSAFPVGPLPQWGGVHSINFRRVA